jgi:hypothetical protein
MGRRYVRETTAFRFRPSELKAFLVQLRARGKAVAAASRVAARKAAAAERACARAYAARERAVARARARRVAAAAKRRAARAAHVAGLAAGDAQALRRQARGQAPSMWSDGDRDILEEQEGDDGGWDDKLTWMHEGEGDPEALRRAPALASADTLDDAYATLRRGASARLSCSSSQPVCAPDDAVWDELCAALPLHTLPQAIGRPPALPAGLEKQLGWLAAAGAVLQPAKCSDDATSTTLLLLPHDAVRCALGALRAVGPGVCLRARIIVAALASALSNAELPWLCYDAPWRGRTHFQRAAAAVKEAQAWLATASGRDSVAVHERMQALQSTCAAFLRDIRASVDAAQAAQAEKEAQARQAAAERRAAAQRHGASAEQGSPQSRSCASASESSSDEEEEYIDSDDPAGGWRDRSVARPRRVSYESERAAAAQERAWEEDSHMFSLRAALASVTGELRDAAAHARAWRDAERGGGDGGGEAAAAAEAPHPAAADAAGGNDRDKLLRLLHDAAEAGQAVLVRHHTDDDR